MYIKDGIVYAGSPEPVIKIINIQALDNYQLRAQFSTGEIKLFDSSYLLDFPVFIPLKDKAVFAKVHLSHGAPCWLDGAVDIAPETVYEKGVEFITD
jgi:hypothetical protein